MPPCRAHLMDVLDRLGGLGGLCRSRDMQPTQCTHSRRISPISTKNNRYGTRPREATSNMLIHASVPGASDGRVGPARWPRWPLPQPRHATYTMHTFPQDLTHFNNKKQTWYTSKRGDGKHRHLFTASADLRVLVVPGVPHGCRCLCSLGSSGV